MKNYKILKALSLIAILLSSPLFAQAPESVMVVEAYSGKILLASNATVKRPVASLNIIGTAAVAVDWATATGADIATTKITVPQTVTLIGGPNPMNLQPGDQLTLRDALYSALLGSDNLAAFSIADHVGREILSRRGKNGDSISTFVGEMNQLAKALAMTQTRFGFPHGLDRPGSRAFSTAADMVRLSAYAMKRNAFNFIVRQQDRNISVFTSSGKRSFLIKNSNELIGEPGILGVKTGTTPAAGPCVSVCMDRQPLVRTKPDGSKGATPRRIMVVVLNNPDRFNRARGLIRQGWSIYDAWLGSGAQVLKREQEILSMPMPL